MDEAEENFGLLGDRGPIPLEGVSVEAEMREFCTRVTITQRYRNREKGPIEAVYVFPLDENAAVCGFEAVVDGTHVVGRVKEREEAFEDYDDAMEAGHGAYLLDEERADVFTANIGNLPPGAEVSIRITYMAELQLEGEAIRFVLPTTVAPRYVSPADRPGVGRPPDSVVNPPIAWDVPYGLDLTVSLNMDGPIAAVESPSHPISVEIRDRRGTVRLATRETAMDRDFVLLVRCDAAAVPRAVVEKDEHGMCTAMLVFQPTFKADRPAESEIVFLVDRSGSMGGPSIDEARNALQLCLRSLSAGTSFNIVGFGSTFESLFPRSRRYDEESLALASRYVAEMDADLGGTEILSPLNAILKRAPSRGTARQLIVLTDGEVYNTDAVIALIREHTEHTRVFAFGIGAGPSHHLIRGMARAGGGTAEFIHPGERIEAKVLRQFDRVLSPALTDIRVEWGDIRAKQAPYKVPAVFSGGRVLVYAFLEDGTAGDVRLCAHGPASKVSFHIPLDPATAERGSILATMAARTMIRDLEEGVSQLHTRRGSARSTRREERIRNEIVRLGVTYGLVSRETSFVAVEEREVPVEEQAELRRVPTMLTTGWGDAGRQRSFSRMAMLGQRSVRSSAVHQRAEEVLCSRLCSLAGIDSLADLNDSLAEFDPVVSRRLNPRFDTADVDPCASRRLDRLVALQHADGSWSLDRDTADALGCTLSEMEAAYPETDGALMDTRRAWATALAVTYIESFWRNEEDEWKLLVEKAKEWLARCQAPSADTWNWIETARNFWETRAVPADEFESSRTDT